MSGRQSSVVVEAGPRSQVQHQQGVWAEKKAKDRQQTADARPSLEGRAARPGGQAERSMTCMNMEKRRVHENKCRCAMSRLEEQWMHRRGKMDLGGLITQHYVGVVFWLACAMGLPWSLLPTRYLHPQRETRRALRLVYDLQPATCNLHPHDLQPVHLPEQLLSYLPTYLPLPYYY